MKRLTRAQFEAEKRLREARGWHNLYVAKMESGAIPSAIVGGKRVEVLAVQDHPVVGRRYSIREGGWVLANEVTDVRGEPRVSVVPAGLFS